MSHKSAKIGITGLVLGLALAGLFWSTLSEGTEYYKHVDEVTQAPEQWYGKKLQLHGYVAKDSLMRRRESLDYKFNIENNGAVIAASYTGIVPDTFKEGSEVVIKGTLGPNGFQVEPNGVMAKCPSKYEAKPDSPVKSAAPGSPAQAGTY